MNSGTELIQKALFLRQRVNLCNENPIKDYREKLEDAFNKEEWEDKNQEQAHKNRKGYADICKNYLRYCCYLLFNELFIDQDKREKLEKIKERFCGALTFFSCVSFFPHNNPQGNVVRGFINWESAIWKDKINSTDGIDSTPLNSAICDVMGTPKCNRKGKQKECQNCIGKLLSRLEFSSTPLLEYVIPNKGILHLPRTPRVTAKNNKYTITEIYEFIFKLREHLKTEDRTKDFSLGTCLKNSFRNTAKQVIATFAQELVGNTHENKLAKLVLDSDTDFLLNIERLLYAYWLQIFNNNVSKPKEWDILSISPSTSRIEGDVKFDGLVKSPNILF